MPAWELAHKAGRKQNKKNATAFLFLAKELPKGMGEQSEANPKMRKPRLPADEKRNLEEMRQAFHNFLQRNSQKGWASEATGLQQSVALYTSSLEKNSNDTLLLKAFEKGELSLLEYLLEMEYFYECFQKRAAERDLAHLLAELTAYTL